MHGTPDQRLTRLSSLIAGGRLRKAKALLRELLDHCLIEPRLFTPVLQTIEHFEWKDGWHAARAFFAGTTPIRESLSRMTAAVRSAYQPKSTGGRFSVVVVVPVWGESHTLKFLNYGLPSLLADGNLPALTGREPRFRIGTTRDDYKLLAVHPAFQRLGQLMPVDIDFIDETRGFNSYERMTYIHNRAIAAYSDREVALSFINSDTVFGSVSLRRAADQLDKGARAVMGLGLRTDEGIAAHHLDRIRTVMGAMPVANRELARIALQSLHQLSMGHFWTQKGSEEDAHYYRLISDDLLLAKCFHLHPIMLRLQPGNPRFVDTSVDHDIVRLLVPDARDVYVATDSDEIFAIELSPVDHRTALRRMPSMQRSLEWAAAWTSSFHRIYAERCIMVHANDIDANAREAVARFDREFDEGYLTHLRSMHRGGPNHGMLYKLPDRA
jgi:hypothetical protein